LFVSFFLPALYIGMTFAVLKQSGKIPNSKVVYKDRFYMAPVIIYYMLCE